MDNTKRITLNKPRLFTPTIIRHIKDGSSGDVFFEKTDGSNFADSSIGVTGSFRYNQNGNGLVSTQQLNVDWADFQNHTFFNSAQVKTNVAFNKIINEYPFDGTRKEIEVFFDKMTGFEKWVYDNMPKHKGSLFFSGTISNSGSETGTVVTVKDIAGSAYPTLSRKTDAEAILDPETKSMTVEMYVYVPSQSLGTRSQSIISKLTSSNYGFAVTNENTPTSTTSSVSFMVVSGTLQDKVSIPVSYNTWTHVCWAWNRNPSVNSIYAYKDATLYTSSSMPIEFGSLGTDGADLYIGSGSALGTYTPNSTFSGSVDELRIWHNVRSPAEIKEYQKKNVFASNQLKLYYKFNEPSGSNSSIVLDHSNNSLHGKLNTRALQLGVREIASGSVSGQNPMSYESLVLCPVLFPNHEDSVELRSELLLSASVYDSQNPSLITNLIPRHWLLEGQSKDGLSTEEGEILNSQDDDDEPKGNKLGGTQVLLSLLYTWAKFFDEMKLYTQAFSSLNKVAYDNTDTIPDEFLPQFAKNEGIDLPPLFVGTSINQYIDGQNLGSEISNGQHTLQYIQNQIWRRILINLPDIIKSKGTIHSIKSFIRSVGIDPDGVFRIREYGGPTKNSLEFSRENRTEISTMLDFVSGGYLVSPYLTSSRVEPGYPYYNSTHQGQGILTSGSFTFEGTYKFEPTNIHSTPQSLVRFKVTGSQTTTTGSLLSNLVVSSGSSGYTLTLYCKPNLASSDLLQLSLTGANIYDGEPWYISCGRVRNDDVDFFGQTDSTPVSGAYFIRAAKQNNGEILESYSTSSYFFESNATDSLFQETITGLSGVFFEIGSGGVEVPSGSLLLLENSVYSSSVRTTTFSGKLTQLRFWSKYLNDLEWKEHVRNFRSVGVQDPKTNWNFVSSSVSGAWSRLRIDASTDQITLDTDSSGRIVLTDFTQNDFHVSGSGFPTTSTVIVPERFTFSYLSPKIDEAISTNKVRVRSFQDGTKLQENPWAQIAPVYETDHSLAPKDSTKLSIDFSIIDSLDQDIMTIFSSLDEMNNYIGRPELMFADGYKDLENLREIYFNKLQDKINLKGFFEFYKWFDTNIGIFVSQLVPRKTKFLGTNFVIESHFLERNKVKYNFEDHWLGDDIRSGLKDTILLQIIVGSFNRY
jgi:hypothetical protein